MFIGDIPVEQLKRMPLETIVLLMMRGLKPEDVNNLGLGLSMYGVHVTITLQDLAKVKS